ncbi:TIGR00725 family protein [Thermosulfidibacter takaii]|uniref:TIGR00725 family protein n=1 Tax=Thermosulfidibacter takaii TaxID=412593 RepID=UPI0009F81FD2
MIGVIGASLASPRDYKNAYELGLRLGELGYPVICGGLTGVMEAVAKGIAEKGGVTIGVVPTYNRNDANQFITYPIATGIGHARNIIIASTADALIAVGGEYGTLSEIAFSLKMGKPVISLFSWDIPGVINVNSVEEAISKLLEVLGC